MKQADLGSATASAPPNLGQHLTEYGFAFVEAAAMQTLLPAPAVEAFITFKQSWDRLGPDRYMADGGRYRRRRHAVFSVGRAGIIRKPHQPHYQSRDYNPLNGGIERWFEPIEPEVASSLTLLSIIGLAERIFKPLSGRGTMEWHVEVHQFRIEAAAEAAGLPTPEGLHRDGVDWVLVMLIARENVAEGVTKIHRLDRQQVGSFCLTKPFDAALVDDHKVYHAVTPVVPIDAGQLAYRDVLVVTFKAIEPLPAP